MKTPTSSTTQESIGFMNLLVLVLSIYVLAVLIVDVVVTLPEETSRMLMMIDNGICIFFLIDFIIRFFKAESKLQFMKWGWIDLISSIPNVDLLRIGRTLRLIRILRILRAFRSSKLIVEHIFKNKAKGSFTTVVILAIILVLFSSIAILQLETEPTSNIKTAEDALWWSYVTITTVGYGDKFPITTGGRIIAAVLMTAGVGIFGTFTAYISSWFLKDSSKSAA